MIRGKKFSAHLLIPGLKGLFLFDFKMHSAHLMDVSIIGLPTYCSFRIQLNARQEAFKIITKKERLQELYPGVLQIEDNLSKVAMREIINRGFKSSAGELYYD